MDSSTPKGTEPMATDEEILLGAGDDEDTKQDEDLEEELLSGDAVIEEEEDGDENGEEGDEDLTGDDEVSGEDDDEEEDENNTSENAVLDETSTLSEESENEKDDDVSMEEDDKESESKEATVKNKPDAGVNIVNAIIAYPVLEEDLNGPVIKPVLKLVKSFFVKFVNLRQMPKEGILDLRFKTEALRNKAFEMLSDVKLCGECQPKIEVSAQSFEGHRTLMSKAVEFITKQNPQEEPTEPVAVFVNNIPLDGRMEMLHFLYPSARSVQLPVNSQGAAMGYAIVEFSNLEEALAVVRNNKEYAARIGDSYLNLHVIGHEEVKAEPEKAEKTAEPPKASASITSPKQKSGKKSEAGVKSAKKSDEKQSPKLSSGKHEPGNKDLKQPQKTEKKSRFSDIVRTRRKSRSPSPRPSKRRHSSGENRSSTRPRTQLFTVFVGNCQDSNSTELRDFLNKEMVSAGICEPDESPVKRASVFNSRQFQFAEFESAKLALTAIKKLDGVVYKGRKLNLQEGQNDLPLRKVAELQKGQSHHFDRKLPRRAPLAENFNVFLGNCSAADPDELRDFLNKQMAEAGLCRPDDYPVKKTQVQEGRLYQFAQFCTAVYAAGAIENLSGLAFKDCTLNVKEGQNDRPLQESLKIEQARLLAGKADDEESTIYIGNCPQASASEFYELFTELLRSKGICGLGEHVIKRVKKKNGRDFQFIVFYEESHAISAVEELDGLMFKGKTLKIKPANRISNSGMEGPEGMVPDFPWQPEPLHSQGFMEDMPRGGNVQEGFDVFVGNVPPTNLDDFEYFFRREFFLRGLCTIDENPISQIKFLKNRQYQFVVFKTAAAAITAISQLNGLVFKGSKLKIQAGQNTPTNPVNVMQPQPMDLPMPMPMQMQMQRSLGLQRTMNMPESINMQRALEMSGTLNMSRSMDAPRVFDMQLPQMNFVQNLLNQASSYITDHVDDETTEGFEVYIGNLPKSHQKSEQLDIMNFIQHEFVKRGLCRGSDRPILRMKFEVGRKYQFVVFRLHMDARSAIEQLDGEVYKGCRIKVKEGIAGTKNPPRQPNNDIKVQQKTSVRAARPQMREERGSRFSSARSIKKEDEGVDIHVGNLPQCRPVELKNFVVKQLQDAGLYEEGDDLIQSVRHFPNKSFKFVTFHDEADAAAAINLLDGVMFRGSKLKVGMGHKKT